VAFSKDGLEIAFIAGGDLWVMDTELLEPKQVTNTPEEERDPVFSPDGDALLMVSDQGGQSDVYRVEKAEPGAFWWQNSTFKQERITNDVDVESDLKWSPDGTKVGFVKGRGDLCVMDRRGKNAKAIVTSWNRPEFDWSPDGKWLVYAQSDNDFNRDIYIVDIDGSKPPFNVSRHPDIDVGPVWSPDGKSIAFTGRRGDNEVDIYYVFVKRDDDEKESRDRKIEKAIDKITKARKKGAAKKADEGKKDDDAIKSEKKPVKVEIDFEGIHERVRHVALSNVTESNLFWSPDSKKLAFSATIDGRTGLFTIEIPEELRPKPLGTMPITQARWLEQGNLVVGLSAGSPASFPGGGGGPLASPAGPSRPTPAARSGDAGASGEGIYRVRARQEVALPQKYRAAFELAWRHMRDGFYDEKLGNRNWDAVRRKYSAAAAEAPDPDGLATVVNLMLGELNGSHLGYVATSGRLAGLPTPGAGPANPPAKWNVATAHLGLRFATDYQGPGLKVKDVVGNSPADQKKSKVEPGEIILSIDGTTVDPSMDLAKVLNGPIDRDIRLLVRDRAGKERTITLRPITYPALDRLLYEQFIKNCRKSVDEASKGRLGYLHIRGMNFPSFHRFEQELYAVGSGKDGLLIDVRNNGGGSTTDHLLTALTQPVHAITVPRGGGPGYPQDRKIYATWNKPIVVLCNQNSFSNAEIFSHAIKTLKRGQLVGVPTAGGVLSTGGTAIMDLGFLRMPGRGWHTINDGEDMELHGAVPDHIIWPQPGELPAGKDLQLNKAVEVLLGEVNAFLAKPRPNLRKSSER
jgi:tricorn protease